MKICELILALPLDEPLYEAFSLLFSPITGHFFMNLFKKYDCDESGIVFVCLFVRCLYDVCLFVCLFVRCVFVWTVFVCCRCQRNLGYRVLTLIFVIGYCVRQFRSYFEYRINSISPDYIICCYVSCFTGDMDADEALTMIKDMLENSVENKVR